MTGYEPTEYDGLLSGKAHAALYQNGFRTIHEVSVTPDYWLLVRPGIGPSTLALIRSAIPFDKQAFVTSLTVESLVEAITDAENEWIFARAFDIERTKQRVATSQPMRQP